MSKKLDLTGQLCKTLRVLSEAPKGNSREYRWNVICEVCKTPNVCSTNKLRGKNAHGCYNCDILSKRKSRGYNGISQLIGSYKRRASKRGYTWALDREEFIILTSSFCRFCGIEPLQVSISHDPTLSEAGKQNSKYIYNGIDRWDNTKGYSLDNCVPCCGECNRMKSDMSGEEYIMRIEKQHKHLRQNV